jgi:pimeloyl-ACP methyl ester carboxylesterase
MTNTATDPRLTSRYVEVDGARWHYYAAPRGADVPLVLVPGLVISSRYMLPLGDRLAQRRTVFAVDLPGFGRSEPAANEAIGMAEFAHALARWMQTLGIARCHLIANSMGCQIAAHFAADFPEVVSTATFIGATIDPRNHCFPTQFGALLHDAFHEPASLWRIWIADFFRAGLFRSVGTARAMFDDYIEQQLPKIRAPLLVIRGGLDPTMPVRWGKEAAAQALRGWFVEIEGEPHCVHYTAPTRAAALIEDFVGAEEAAPGSTPVTS